MNYWIFSWKCCQWGKIRCWVQKNGNFFRFLDGSGFKVKSSLKDLEHSNYIFGYLMTLRYQTFKKRLRFLDGSGFEWNSHINSVFSVYMVCYIWFGGGVMCVISKKMRIYLIKLIIGWNYQKSEWNNYQMAGVLLIHESFDTWIIIKAISLY